MADWSARAFLQEPLVPGSFVEFTIPDTNIGQVVVGVVRRLESELVDVLIGFEFEAAPLRYRPIGFDEPRVFEEAASGTFGIYRSEQAVELFSVGAREAYGSSALASKSIGSWLGDLFVVAFIVADEDSVSDAELFSPYPPGVCAFPPMEVAAAQGAVLSAAVSMRPLSVFASGMVPGTGEVEVSFESLVAQATAAAVASAQVSFEPLTLVAGQAPPVTFNSAHIYSSAMFVSAVEYPVYTGGCQLYMRPMQLLAVEESTYSHTTLSFEGLFAFGMGGPVPPVQGIIGTLPSLTFTPVFTDDLMSGVSSTTALDGRYGFHAASTLTSSDALAHKLAMTTRSRGLATDQLATEWVRTLALLVQTTASDDYQLATTVSIDDVLTSLVGVSVIEAVPILDRLRATDSTQTFRQLTHSVLELLRGLSTISDADAAAVYSSATVLDTLQDRLLRFAEVLDVHEAIATAQGNFHLTIALTDPVTASDSVSPLAHFRQNLHDVAFAHLLLRLGDEEYVGWVMNTEGRRPISEYKNFNFNAIAKVGGTYYATGDSGLYALGGDTDEGELIEASLTTMMLDFGSPVQKRVHAAYLGYASDGRMVLKVRAEDQGHVVEHWYEAVAMVGDAAQTQMVRLGRGLRSRYWQFELVNADGADFEVQMLEVHPVFLNRRV